MEPVVIMQSSPPDPLDHIPRTQGPIKIHNDFIHTFIDFLVRHFFEANKGILVLVTVWIHDIKTKVSNLEELTFFDILILVWSKYDPLLVGNLAVLGEQRKSYKAFKFSA